MKYYFKIITIIIISITTSCTNFLSTEPNDFVSPENYYLTENDLNAALTGVYDVMGTTDMYGYRMVYMNGLEGDDGYFARASPNIGPKTHNFTASDHEVTVFWTRVYQGITRANLLLQNVNNNLEISEDVRNVIRGEALFLRAYYYFLLTQSYGNVPMILEPVESANQINFPATPSVEIYEQIIKDMTEAEGLVLGMENVGFGGRVTKSAVRGILARVCLHMAGAPLNGGRPMYIEARKWAKMVIDDQAANHRLSPSFPQIFINYAQDLYDPAESIWEVEFWGNNSTGHNETGHVSGPASRNKLTGIAFGGIRVTTRLFDLYDEADQRKYWSIANWQYSDTGPSGTKTYMGIRTRAHLYLQQNGKWRREYELAEPKRDNVGPQNFPILRFSDVLLMFAEAENEIDGPTSEAIGKINLLRRTRWSRSIKSVNITSGGSGYSSAPTVTFSGGGGSGAQATAVITNGSVTDIVFTRNPLTSYNRGQSYTSAPTITFTGGGSGVIHAAATATINKIEDADIPAESIASPRAFKEFIQDERSRELCFEGLRKHDLIRWGIFVKSMHDVADKILEENDPTKTYFEPYFRNVEEKHLLWPIPSYETTLNKSLKQNNGW